MLERFYRSKIGLLMAQPEDFWLVRLSDDLYGLYVSKCYNHFNTPLMVKGTRDEVQDFMLDLDIPRGEV